MPEFESLLPIAFISLFSFGSLVIFLRILIEKRIERYHPEEWERLRKPKMFSGEPEVNTNFVAYLNKKEYKHLNDEKLEYINRIASIVSWALLPLLLVVVLLFLISWGVL